MWKPFHCIFRAEPFCKTFDVVLFWSIFGSLHSYSRFPKAWQMPLGKRAFFEEFAVPKSKMHFHLRPSNDFPLGQNYLKIPLSHASQCWKIKQKSLILQHWRFFVVIVKHYVVTNLTKKKVSVSFSSQFSAYLAYW